MIKTLLSSCESLKIYYHYHYGNANTWSDELASIFLLNLNVQTSAICEKFDHRIDDHAAQKILAIQANTIFKYVNYYKTLKLEKKVKQKMIKEMDDRVYNMFEEQYFSLVAISGN